MYDWILLLIRSVNDYRSHVNSFFKKFFLLPLGLINCIFIGHTWYGGVIMKKDSTPRRNPHPLSSYDPPAHKTEATKTIEEPDYMPNNRIYKKQTNSTQQKH